MDDANGWCAPDDWYCICGKPMLEHDYQVCTPPYDPKTALHLPDLVVTRGSLNEQEA